MTILLVIFTITGAVWAKTVSPDLLLGHPVYSLLDRFDARGWIDVSDTRALSRNHIVQMLRAVSDQPLTIVERDLVGRYLAELDDQPAFAHEPRWAWRDSAAQITVLPVFRQQVNALRGELPRETVSQTYVGGAVRGRFHTLVFRIRHFEAREWSNQVRIRREEVLARPIEGVQLKGKKVDFRESVFQLAWANKWVRIDGGKGSLNWGPGRSGNLLLSDHAPSYGLFRIQASYKQLHYTHIAGSLQAQPGLIDTTRRWIDNGHVRIFLRQKRLAAHRLEIAFSRVRVGLHEAVVYGDRGFEPLYVLPLSVFAGVQNHLGNHDNLMIGADVSVRVRKGVEFYTAWFFDDMVKFNFDAFANKFAFQLGLFWVDPGGLSDTDFRAEYVRIEPFVYSHNFDINTAEHYDALLGYPAGPNSDRWFGQITRRFSPWVNASLHVVRERQGQNPVNQNGTVVNVGGDAQLGRRPNDLPVRNFMAGHVETRTIIGGVLRFEPVSNWALKTMYEYNRLEIQQRQTTGHIWTASLDVNFH